MKKNLVIEILITISTIGLGLAMLPELHKVVKKPETVKSLSPTFLGLRTFFFIFLGTGLFLKNDKSLLLMVILCAWYTLCYAFFLIMYFFN